MHTCEPTTETKISINSKKPKISYNHFEDLREIARNDSWKGRNQEESQPQSPSLSQRRFAARRRRPPSASTPPPPLIFLFNFVTKRRRFEPVLSKTTSFCFSHNLQKNLQSQNDVILALQRPKRRRFDPNPFFAK